MNIKIKILVCLSLIIILLMVSGCFAGKQPIENDLNEISHEGAVESAAKCHVLDGSIIIFNDGFKIKDNTIYGNGDRYYLLDESRSVSIRKIQLDSIIAVTTYETPATRMIANVVLGITGGAIAGVATYCVICPKCCFGSCPTVYSFDGSKYSMETELFSQCISKQLEADDLDMLLQKVPDDGNYKLRVTNEALETHYINRMNLILAEHPAGTRLYTNNSGGYTIVRSLTPANSALNSKGLEITDKIAKNDNETYRSEKEMTGELKKNIAFDWLELSVPVPENAANAIMVVRYRNTLLSTILFYDIVLSSQGAQAVDWTSRMNNDPAYASQFKMIYDAFSGIQVEVNYGGIWKSSGRLPDSGPISWKYMAVEIPANDQKELKIRLKFIPDNFMIDYVGFDFSSIPENAGRYEIIYPSEIRNKKDNSMIDINNALYGNDRQYYVTNPGELIELTYKISKRYDVEQTLFISSAGYYNEWIRGSWIRNNNSGYKFDLYKISETLRVLARSWEENKELIEAEFFKTRIPIKEK